MHERELRALLTSCAVPVHTWGIGEAKTVNHLLKEVSSGEAFLVQEGGRLVRKSEGSILNVYYDDGLACWYLLEDRQVFKDGRTRTRDLTSSIGEKMKYGEDPIEAAYRALEEELGIVERIPLVEQPLVVKGPIPSQSFPGLFTVYTMHAFNVFLPDSFYKPEGYEEHQEDKTTYFSWRKCTKARA